jgi:hypothetical protein
MMTDAEALEAQGGARHRLSEWRRLAGIAYRDPEHVATRLTLYGAERLAEDSLAWASRVQEERPDVPRAVIAEELRIQTAQASRINGAVSGTPFLIALVPGYLAYLWQEGVMERRLAALYGHDPREMEVSANVLVLRGVHPTTEEATAALVAVRDAPLPEKPTSRRSMRVWVRSIYTHLRRVPRRSDERGGEGRALAAEGDAGPARGRRDLGGHLGAARELHDRDGVGL